ncbi:baseplate assembly protein [Acetobacter thailandicus]|nr:baseplate assembly protein [Acetobacter thailandicus]OUJ11819.1 baseplate assembly protein [Acetobacter sp. DsW_059]
MLFMSSSLSSSLYPVFHRADAAASDFNALNAVVARLLSTRRTVMLVQVCAVSGTGLEPVGFVDVQPMVHQQNAAGQVTPHGVVFQVPYFRLQGGIRAVITDPVVGDIGLALVADRDSFNVKTARAAAAPGSFRQHNIADALYLGGFLNAAPREYIWMNESGVSIKTEGTFSVNAQNVEITGGVSVKGDLSVSGDVTGRGISLSQHTHPGVQPGAGQTGTPVG